MGIQLGGVGTMLYTTTEMIDLLHSTLIDLEQADDLDRDDPAVVEFKASILRSIAELEAGNLKAA
jgi:hypothetical protein